MRSGRHESRGSNDGFVVSQLDNLMTVVADSRRIDRVTGVVPAGPRGGFRLSLRDVE